MAIPSNAKVSFLIRSLLKRRGWNQKILSGFLGVSPATVSNIVRLRREVDPRLARALAEIFEIKEEDFMLPRPRPVPKVSKLDFTYSKCHLEDLPFWDMHKRDWISIENLNDSHELKKAAYQFFGIKSGASLQAEADSTVSSGDTVTATDLAWLCQVRKIARMMPARAFAAAEAEAERENWIALRRNRSNVSHIAGLLDTLGIRFLIVEALSGSRIDSACLWLGGSEPVIALTLQHHSLDEVPWLVYEQLRHIPNRDRDLRTKITKSPEAGTHEQGAGDPGAKTLQPESRALYSKFKARVSKMRHFSRNTSIVVDGWGKKFLETGIFIKND